MPPIYDTIAKFGQVLGMVPPENIETTKSKDSHSKTSYLSL